jgi:ABC-type cobalt transport system substrate-binding protein
VGANRIVRVTACWGGMEPEDGEIENALFNISSPVSVSCIFCELRKKKNKKNPKKNKKKKKKQKKKITPKKNRIFF